MEKKLLFLLLSMPMTITYAQDDGFFGDKESIELKFGGWSKHYSDKHPVTDTPLNENHKGLGIEYYRNIKETDHFLGTGIWYMKDSFGGDSFQAAVSYKYRINDLPIIDSIDLNINIGAVNRLYRQSHYWVYPDINGNIYKEELNYYEDKRKTKLLVSPFITFNWTEHIQTDFTYLPPKLAEQLGSDFGVFFFRLGYKF